VVCLDAVALEDVGVDGALPEELDPLDLLGLLLEDHDELGSDDLPLLLGVGDSGELVEEPVGGVDVHEVRAEVVAEHVDDLLGLALAEQAVVDVDAGEVLADGFDQQRGAHGGVDASGERQQHLAVADLLPQGFDLFVDERISQLGGGDADHRFGAHVSVHDLHFLVIRGHTPARWPGDDSDSI